MQGTKNLTEGVISRQLFNLAMPIMATSFIQMAYSLTDMAWVGRLGSESMAAVGAVGILTWMSGSIALLNKVGAEVSVGQSIGARSEEDARSFASHNITIALLISVCWGGLLFLFARPILNIFELKQHITDAAVTYLRIVSTGLPFIFLSAAFTGIYNAAGRSKIPFYISGTGLIMNIVLDPLFIFGFGWGTVGAALATWLSEATVFGIFVYKLRGKSAVLGGFSFIVPLKKKYTRRIFKLGLPVATLNTLFAFVNMFLSRTGAGRTHRTDGIHHRRTNRGHHLEYFARILHGAEHVHRPELCRGAEVAREASMAHHHVDDGRIRKPLLTTVHLLRQRGVLYLRTRGRSLPCGWRFPPHRRLFANVHDDGNYHAGRVLRTGTDSAACHCQHRMQLHAYSGGVIAGAHGYGSGCHLVGSKWNDRCQRSYTDSLVRPHQKENSLKKDRTGEL